MHVTPIFRRSACVAFRLKDSVNPPPRRNGAARRRKGPDKNTGKIEFQNPIARSEAALR